MASASDQYVEFDEFVEYHLTRTRSNIKLTDVLTAVVGIAALVVGYLLVFTLLDHWVIDGGFGYWTRAAMLALIVVVAIAWIVWKVILPATRPVNQLYAADVIENGDPALKSSVRNLVDLAASKKKIRPEIRKAMEKQAALRLSEVDVENTVDRKNLMRFAYLLLFLVVASCLYALFSPKKISFLRSLTLANTGVATQTEILEVTPGDVEVIAGGQVEIKTSLKGKVPDSVRILYSLEDRSIVDEPIEMQEVENGLREFKGTINGLNSRGILQGMTYRVVAGDAQSDEFHITVNRPPSALVDGIELTFPGYMEFADRNTVGGDIDAYEGTAVRLTATANMPVKVARLEFFDNPEVKGEEKTLRIDGKKLSTEWTLELGSDGSFQKHYRIYVENENGDTDPRPTTYSINIKPDKPPEVTLFDPTRDIELPANGVLPLLIEAKDPDFKLRAVNFRFERVGEDIEQVESIYDGLIEGFRKEWSGQHEFRLERHGFEDGDIIRFWIEARDNRPPLGNRAATLPLKIRITRPQSQREVEKKLEKDRKVQEEIKKEVEEDKKAAEENQAQQAGKDGDPNGQQDEDGDQKSDKKNDDQDPDAEKQDPGNEGPPEDEPGSEKGMQERPADPDGENKDGELDQERSGKADDDEALQKLIEKMQEQEDQNAGDPNPDNENDEGEGNPDKIGDQTGKPESEDQKDPGQQEPGDNAASGEDPNAESTPGDTEGGQEKTPEGDSKEPKKEGGNTKVENDDKDPNLNEGKADDPKGGESKPDEEGTEPVQRKPGDGDETGKAKPGDKNADATNAKKPDQIEREGDDPTLRDPKDPKDPNEKPSDNADPKQQKTEKDDQGGQAGKPKNGSNSDPQKKNDSKGQQASPNDDPSQQKGNQQDREDSSKQKTPNGMNDKSAKPGENGDSDSGKSENSKSSDAGKSDQSSDSQDKGKSEGKSDNKSGDPKGDQAGDKAGNKPGANDKPGGEGKKPGSEGGEAAGKSDPKGANSEQKPGGAEQNSDAKQEGEKANAGGEKKPGEKANKKSGEKKGGENKKGADSKPKSKGKGGKSKGKESGKSGGSSEAEGESGGGGSKGKGSKGKNGAGGSSDQASANPGEGEGSGSGDASGSGPDDPNLDDAKKAANLVLDKLDKELSRGEIDDKLLKELGWNEKDLAGFKQRLQKQLRDKNPNNEVSPQSEAARRRFEQMLKSLNLNKARNERVGTSERDRTMRGINSRQIQAPPDYRDVFEAYKRNLSKQKTKK